MKILSPAGNFESLKMAVNYGADEVYLGINEFNARNNIDGFNMENLQEAVDYARIHGVKVLLAINILFNDDELVDAVDIVIKSYNIGVDAFIIQDLGLAKILSDNYPEIELHASTQMGIHNLEGVKAISSYGFKRVVLARETPLSEVKRIRKNSNIEIEYFAHGALCVSFSGNCYLSERLLGASGNRGKCKQLCRLPYSFFHNNQFIKKGFMLSAKDFDMRRRLQDLSNAGVDVIKIEGRARRPFYVGAITKEYRKVLNGLNSDENVVSLAFNRGFTEGYFNGNGDVISNIQNHVGVSIGKVYKINNGKNFNEVFFSSNRKLNEKSAFKFFEGERERCTVSAYDLTPVCNDKYRLTTKSQIKVGDKVNLIVDYNLEKEILSFKKKIPVALSVFATADLPIKVLASVKDVVVEVVGDKCQVSKRQPLIESNIIDNFSKSDIFSPIIDKIELKDAFLSKAQLNQLRRDVYFLLKAKILATSKRNLQKKNYTLPNKVFTYLDDVEFVDDLDKPFFAKNVVYSPEEYEGANIKKFIEKCVKNGKKPFLDTPNFALENDINFLYDIIEKTHVAIVANNNYALTFNTDIVIGTGLNVYNAVTFNAYGKDVLKDSGKNQYPFMTFRHCPLKSHLKCGCDNCLYDGGYFYKMDSGKVLRLKRKKLSSCTFYLTN